MGVGNHSKFAYGTAIPQSTESIGMQDADARIVGTGVKVVIVNRLDDRAGVTVLVTQQKGTGLVVPLGA